MFCKNCGQELSSSAKFCPGCGTAIEDDKPKIQSIAPEKGVDDSILHESAGKNLTDTDSSIENNLDETEKKAVQAQLTESPFAPEQANNVVVDNANESKQIETAKSENSATDNIKEVLLPQKGKNGRVRFKDLSSKQKAIRLGIGGLLLLIGIIWIVSDGVKGSEKAGKTDAINVIPYNCDTGAVFKMTLEEFSKSFSKSVMNYYDIDFNLYDLYDSPTDNKEDSGVSYQLYSAEPITDGIMYVKVIDDYVAGIVITPDYTSDTYKDKLKNIGEAFNHSVLALGHFNADEEQKMVDALTKGCDEYGTTASYIKESINIQLFQTG